MRKPRQQGQIITADDLKEYLATQDDFALELFVYRKARDVGFKAIHGGTYKDPVTKKPRQFDVRAFLQLETCRLHIAIECKTLLPSYPLLLSQVPRTSWESFHQLINSDIETAATHRPITPSGNYSNVVRHVGSDSIYPVGEFVAKTIRQVGRDGTNFRSGDDGVYDKWSQSLASADELVAVAERPGITEKKLLTFVLPVLVVSDETLWIANYAEDGSEIADPVQVDESVLFVDRGYDGPGRIRYTISHLHILTKKQVGPFFERFMNLDYRRQIFHRYPYLHQSGDAQCSGGEAQFSRIHNDDDKTPAGLTRQYNQTRIGKHPHNTQEGRQAVSRP